MEVRFLNYTCNSQRYNKPVTFKAHRDFEILKEKYDLPVTSSSYFRRGRYVGTPDEEYADVIKALDMTFLDADGSEKKQMLIAGIGESQEPFSDLAVIKSLIKDKQLDDVMDLHIVDLQSKPDDKVLFEHSFFDCNFPPRFAKDSFVTDDGSKIGLPVWQKYRVKDEIFNFLKKTYNDVTKSHWETRVQEAVSKMPSESFNLISINNTLGYIDNCNVIYNTMENIMRILKRGGRFITDPDSRFNGLLRFRMAEIYKGIFLKL